MRGTLRDLTFTGNGRQVLSVTLDGDFRENFDKMRDKPVEVQIKPYRKKRSKNANDYLWVLCDKIAASQGITAVEVYRKEIRDAGTFEDFLIKNERIEKFSTAWSEKGLGWFTLLVDDYGGDYKQIRAYYGSSSYNTAEMSRLINATIEDAKALGIETATPEELSILIDEWKIKQ